MKVHRFTDSPNIEVTSAYLFRESDPDRVAVYLVWRDKLDNQTPVHAAYAYRNLTTLVFKGANCRLTTWEEVRLELLILYDLTYEQILNNMVLYEIPD